MNRDELIEGIKNYCKIQKEAYGKEKQAVLLDIVDATIEVYVKDKETKKDLHYMLSLLKYPKKLDRVIGG